MFSVFVDVVLTMKLILIKQHILDIFFVLNLLEAYKCELVVKQEQRQLVRNR